MAVMAKKGVVSQPQVVFEQTRTEAIFMSVWHNALTRLRKQGVCTDVRMGGDFLKPTCDVRMYVHA